MTHAPLKPSAFLEICQTLEARGAAPVTLEALCEAHGISLFALNRLFKKYIGVSPKSWTRTLRLNEAAILLARSDLDILTISCAVGYESQQGFSRAFVRAYGQTPTLFRQNFGLQQGVSQPQVRRPLDVTLKALAPTRIVRRRYLGNYDDVPQHWHDFAACISNRPHRAFAPQRFFGLTWDDPALTPPGQIRYDCAYVLDDAVPPSLPPECVVCELPAGIYASMNHKGRYTDAIGGAYTTLVCEWLPMSGRQLDLRPALEWYTAPPWQQPIERWDFSVWIAIF